MNQYCLLFNCCARYNTTTTTSTTTTTTTTNHQQQQQQLRTSHQATPERSLPPTRERICFSRNRSFNVHCAIINNSARVETLRKCAKEHINESTNTAIQIAEWVGGYSTRQARKQNVKVAEIKQQLIMMWDIRFSHSVYFSYDLWDAKPSALLNGVVIWVEAAALSSDVNIKALSTSKTSLRIKKTKRCHILVDKSAHTVRRYINNTHLLGCYAVWRVTEHTLTFRRSQVFVLQTVRDNGTTATTA